MNKESYRLVITVDYSRINNNDAGLCELLGLDMTWISNFAYGDAYGDSQSVT